MMEELFYNGISPINDTLLPQRENIENIKHIKNIENEDSDLNKGERRVSVTSSNSIVKLMMMKKNKINTELDKIKNNLIVSEKLLSKDIVTQLKYIRYRDEWLDIYRKDGVEYRVLLKYIQRLFLFKGSNIRNVYKANETSKQVHSCTIAIKNELDEIENNAFISKLISLDDIVTQLCIIGYRAELFEMFNENNIIYKEMIATSQILFLNCGEIIIDEF